MCIERGFEWLGFGVRIPAIKFYELYPHDRQIGWEWNEVFIEDELYTRDHFIELE